MGLGESILKLYRQVTGNETATFQEARERFAELKVYEPLARARRINPLEKERILDGEYEETPISEFLDELEGIELFLDEKDPRGYELSEGNDWEDAMYKTAENEKNYDD
ncbi:MAG: hypothetical protein WC511_05095 [Candidatus Pacearchaeota archaeon]|jgi:hypothetical protein